MKKLLLLLFIPFVLLLSACSGGIDTDEAQAYITDFLEAVENNDYKTAKTFLHPDRPADLESYFTRIETRIGLEFSDIKINKFADSSWSYYDSEVDGSQYTVDVFANVDGVKMEIEIEIVENDNGYGIYEFEIDFD